VPGKEVKKTEGSWKKVLWSIGGTLGIYLLLQLFGAVLISGEKVSVEKTALLVGLFAGIAAFVSPVIFLRREKNGRLSLCVGAGLGFVAVVAAVGLAGSSWESVIGGVWTVLLPTLVGSALAAVLGGAGKKKGYGIKGGGRKRGYIK